MSERDRMGADESPSGMFRVVTADGYTICYVADQGYADRIAELLNSYEGHLWADVTVVAPVDRKEPAS